jgi:hypothetical protein
MSVAVYHWWRCRECGAVCNDIFPESGRHRCFRRAIARGWVVVKMGGKSRQVNIYCPKCMQDVFGIDTSKLKKSVGK